MYSTLTLLCLIALSNEARGECTASYVTTCDSVNDTITNADSEWTTLIIQNKMCVNKTCAEPEEVLKYNDLTKLPNLEELYIIGSLIDVERGAFNGLDRLRYLRLHKNTIRIVHADAFVCPSDLTELNLRENRIEDLERGVFTNNKIGEINLAHNNLSTIQAERLNVVGLKKLILSYNKIFHVADGSFSSELEYLDLSYNRIKRLGAGVFTGLEKLKQLILRNNRLEIVSPVTVLRNLEIVDLSHNNIQLTAKDAFVPYEKIKEIHLEFNRLIYLNPKSFPKTSRLQRLHLHRNLLTHIPSAMEAALGELRFITLGGNPWSCACLGTIEKYVRAHNISQSECDRKFFSEGTSPICLVAGEPGDECRGDESDMLLREQPEDVGVVVHGYKCREDEKIKTGKMNVFV